MTQRTRGDKLALTDIALFLDVDGTLLELAPTPEAVSVTPELRARLQELASASGGAVALVSGRALADLDALFAPLALPSAGLHGFERRGICGDCHRRPLPSAAALRAARHAMLDLAERHDGLSVEDKRFALALHYRKAPHLKEAVLKAMAQTAAGLGEELELQHGKMVVEVRPAGATKASAVSAFLAEAPFAGRFPVFIGDDLTDESAFELVNSRDGLSVLVSAPRPSAARARLADVPAVHAWLAQLQRQPSAALRQLSAAAARSHEREGAQPAAPRAARSRSRS